MLAALCAAPAAAAQTNLISTVAGTGVIGSAGDDGPATLAELGVPISVVGLPGGGFLIADQVGRIRRVSAAGVITTLAGSDVAGYDGDGGTAVGAKFDAASDVEMTSGGEFLIADSNNNAVRFVDAGGMITTVVGGAGAGYNGDDIAASTAKLSFPADIAVIPGGGYLVADVDNHRIRKVLGGVITTVAGTGVAGFNGDGPVATAQLNKPSGVAVTPDGGFLVADTNNQRIRKVLNGNVTTVAGSGAVGYEGDGGAATSSTFNSPIRVAVTPDAGFLVADRFNHSIRKVDALGGISTVAGTGTAGYNGDDILAATAQLDNPFGVGVTAEGDYLIADVFNRRIRMVDSAALLPPPAPGPPPPETPPAPPAPVLSERNVTPPQISFKGRVGGQAQYSCSTGTWEGLAADPAFQYTWLRLNDLISFDPLRGLLGPRSTQVGTGPTHNLAAADVGKKFYCVVQARVGLGRLLSASSPTSVLTGGLEGVKLLPILLQARAFGDFRIRGIDVLQVVQPTSNARMFGFLPDARFPLFCGGGTPTAFMAVFRNCVSAGRDPQRVGYQGVPLDQRKRTTAFVYVDMKTPATVADQPLDVTLSARLGGRRLSGAITKQLRNPQAAGLAWIPSIERGRTNFAVGFTVPAAWLALGVLSGDRLDLEANVSLPAGAGAGALVECALFVTVNCSTDNHFRVDGLPVFDDFPDLTIRSLQLLNGAQTLTAPDRVLAKALQIFPGGDRVSVQPYSGTLDISAAAALVSTAPRCANFVTPPPPPPALPAPNQAAQDTRSCRIAAVSAVLDQWWLSDTQNRSGYNMLLAVHRYPASPGAADEPGSKRGSTVLTTPGQMPTLQINDGSLNRPLTAAAHEYGHALTLPHAGQNCNGTRVGNPQQGEPWPADDTGRLQGITAEPTFVRLRPVLRTRVDGTPNPLFDFMSYCASNANDPDSWLSARNWNRTFKELRDFSATLRGRAAAASQQARAAQAAQAMVIGEFGPAGARIVRVLPRSSENLPDPSDPASPLRLRALSSTGAVLSETGIRLEAAADADAPVGSFATGFPGDATTVQLIAGGAVVDSKQQSRPPSVRIRSVRTGRTVRVTWTASDPDGDPLLATVDYLPDGGGGSRHVFQGPDRGRATISGSHLESSARGRVVVTVNDGFRNASAQSGVFAVAGSPPRATMVLPHVGDDAQAGRVRLIGRGSDDHGRSLRGRALTWFGGSRKLGTGEKLTATLRPGRVALRLVARDRQGRAATVTRRITVTPVLLQIRTIGVPPRVKRGAKTVRVKIATTVPATLSAAGRRYAVSRKTRTVAIRLPSRPRTGLLRIRLTLTAKGAKQRVLRESIVTLRI